MKRGGLLACFFKHVFGEAVGQAEFADDGESIDPGLAARAEDLSEAAFAAVLGGRKAEHFEDDLVFRPRAFGAGVADVDAVAEDGAVDANETLAVALEIGSDELAGGASQALPHDSGRPKVGAVGLAGDAHQALVAGGGVEAVALADDDLGARFAVDQVGPHETRAGGGTAIDAGNGAVGLTGADRAVLNNLA